MDQVHIMENKLVVIEDLPSDWDPPDTCLGAANIVSIERSNKIMRNSLDLMSGEAASGTYSFPSRRGICESTFMSFEEMDVSKMESQVIT